MSLTASRLEYAYAFDLMEWPGDGPLLAVVSTPEFVDLTLARTVTPVTFWCEGEVTLAHARQRLEEGYLPDSVAATCAVRPAGVAGQTERMHRGAIWAAPQRATWRGLSGRIQGALDAAVPLCVLSATRIGAALRRFRRAGKAGEPIVPAGRVASRLRLEGWRVESEVGIGGVAGVAWAAASRGLALAGRPDMADRAERAHHDAVPDARGASFTLLRATPLGRAD